MRFIQNPKVLQVIIFFLLLVSGLSIMAKIETEVKLSKTITILHGVESENQMLKTKIIELEKQISESNAEMRWEHDLLFQYYLMSRLYYFFTP